MDIISKDEKNNRNMLNYDDKQNVEDIENNIVKKSNQANDIVNDSANKEMFNKKVIVDKAAPFAHLHVHTEYSLLDGCLRVERMLEQCKKFNMKAVAVTDHGNMFCAYHFYMAAVKAGIKPIIGCEFYMCPDIMVKQGKVAGDFNHLILLAKNDDGYHSLCKLNSIAYVDGFYYKPRIDMALLRKYSNGLVCLSACLAGQLQQLLLQNRYDDADATVKEFKAIFGEDYYIELQDHNLEEQKYVNPFLIKLARANDVKLVATNDVHYLERKHAEAQDILMCVQMGKFDDDENRLKFPNDEFYFKSYEEMAERFANIPESITNTMEIVDKCNVKIERKKLLPNYIPPDNLTPSQYLRQLMEDGLLRKYKVITPEIRNRAEYEFDVVNKMGFVEYYLIVWDFIHYSESKGIPVGPGRGSGAGSIIAYAIGITKIEPLRFNLFFERFLNPERVSMPDFDIDFCVDRRGEVIDYVIKKYGAPKVAQIVTFGTMATKAAFKDVARVLRFPYSEVDKITKLIPQKASLKRLFGIEPLINDAAHIQENVPELREVYSQNSEIKRIVDLAVILEGTPRNTSMHAAGVVICRDDISDHVPLQRNGNDITTQYNMKEVEELGLLKMDFLGLRTLTDIDKAVKLVKKNENITIDLYDTDYSDPNVYKLMSSGDTDAVFQLESGGMKNLMKRLQPNSLEDVTAGISLFRPGPMDSIDSYIAAKRDSANIKYKHPLLKPILETTYGCLVYQEQVMKIVQQLAGYTLGQADIIRRAMGKKDAKTMAENREYFIHGKKDKDGNVIIKGAVNNGVSESVAEEVFKEMEIFAQYAFNKAHAAAYAVVSYQTAYLKYYYPIEYLAAVLNNRINNSDEIIKYIGYCIERGIKVLEPDINKSQAEFDVDNGRIRFGLLAVKGVGLVAINKIIEEREKRGDFKDIYDFINRVDSSALNKRMIEGFIKAGVFDSTGAKRAQLMQIYGMIMDSAASEKKQKESGQFSFFDMEGDKNSKSADIPLPNVEEYASKQKYAYEKEVLGMYVSGSPLEVYKSRFKDLWNTGAIIPDEELEDSEKDIFYEQFDRKSVVMGGILTEVEISTDRNAHKIARAKLEDLYGVIEVTIWSREYEKLKDIIAEDLIGSFSGTLSVRTGFKPSLFVNAIQPWSDKPLETVNTPIRKRLYLKINQTQLDAAESIIESYPGEIDVIYVLDTTKTKFKSKNKVRECYALISELETLLSNCNIKFMNNK
ncbi:MAG: DNA polymerase III subunit alpha [Clostridia bacterium]